MLVIQVIKNPHYGGPYNYDPNKYTYTLGVAAHGGGVSAGLYIGTPRYSESKDKWRTDNGSSLYKSIGASKKTNGDGVWQYLRNITPVGNLYVALSIDKGYWGSMSLTAVGKTVIG